MHEERRSICLFTLWQERPASVDGSALWRFSLEDARTGERQGFTSLDQMMTFLEEHVLDRAQNDTLE